ncbi:glycosyltransferase, partial [bacterium]|nr:glycosyltransferase [candidate division CSSED10-310 bacterium]
MKRLLVFGLSPLPFENTTKNFGPGIRAWQFIQPLLQHDCEVMLLANRIPYIYPENTPPEVTISKGSFNYTHMSDHVFRNQQKIQAYYDRFKPDAILSATIFASPPLKTLKTDLPIWIDLFGHVMAEAQAKAYRYQSNDYLEHFWKHEISALETGDIFSTVSKAQEYATIGELGLLGRLSAQTTGYRFTRVIPCAMDPDPLEHKTQAFRGIDVPEDAFVVLWSGGYNTWTDIDTLFEGLDKAMSKNPDIWFVSTGGQIDGHDEKTYPKFLRKIAKSRYKNRFIMKGWIPKIGVTDYYFEADIGINIDLFMYEGMFGSKNRVLDWMRAGLPSLIGELCELSHDLPEKKLAFNYPLQNADALAEKLLYLAKNRDMVRETGQRAKEFGLKYLTFEASTRMFQNWLISPEKSPDHSNKNIKTPSFISSRTKINSDTLTSLQNAHDHILELENY